MTSLPRHVDHGVLFVKAGWHDRWKTFFPIYLFDFFSQKSVKQPNETVLTLRNSIFPLFFSADERLATGEFRLNGKEISAVLFRMEKEDYLWS